MKRHLFLPTAAAAVAGLTFGAVAAPSATGAVPGSAPAVESSADPAGTDEIATAEAQAEKVAARSSGEAVMGHLEELEKIAAANDNTRAVGTPGYEAAAEYVESVLADAGYEPTRQYFSVENSIVDAFEFSVTGVEVDALPMTFSNSTPDGGITGSLVEPAQIEGCDAAAWQGVDVTDEVALVSRGTCSFGEKAVAAGKAGAAAVIVYNNTEGPLNGTLGEVLADSAPALGVTQAEGAALRAAADDAETVVQLDLQVTNDPVETFNILAETPTGRADNVVMVGAHLDGVPEGPGINDNASGSAAILESAVQLAKAGGQTNKVRFAWWGAEEIGLLGSAHYVADLQENNPREIDRIATYLNFDMVGSPNYVIGVYDADESTYEAPVAVPDGSIATEKIFTDYFDRADQPWVDSEFSGRSDYQAFIEADIPASGLFTGADGSKTQAEVDLFGGTVGEMYDPNYHTPADTLENVSAEALDIMVPAITYAVTRLSRTTEDVNGVLPYAAWRRGVDYPKSARVVYQGKAHVALKANRSKLPRTIGGYWAEIGDKQVCRTRTVRTWTSTWRYLQTGGLVAHKNRLYKSVKANRGTEPGTRGSSVAWRQIGPC